MDTSGRVKLIQQVRDTMEGQSWQDSLLVLAAFGYDTRGFEDSMGPSVQDLLVDGTEEQLVLLAQHLDVDVPGLPQAASSIDAAPQPPAVQEPLFLFASHLAKHRSFLGEVASELQVYGITLFVAHSSIEPDQEWHEEIVKALRNCHGGVAFLHDGFRESAWCDQEVGWLLGRQVPVFSLKFDLPPYGPLGKWQAAEARHLNAPTLTQSIIEMILKRDQLRPNYLTSLCKALIGSPNFNTTDRIWNLLHDIIDLDDYQCGLVMDAVETNGQVAQTKGMNPWSGLDGTTYADAIPEFLTRQVGASAVATRIASWRARLS